MKKEITMYNFPCCGWNVNSATIEGFYTCPECYSDWASELLEKKVISREQYEGVKERELKDKFINDVLFNSRKEDEDDCWDYKDMAACLYNNITECWEFYFKDKEMPFPNGYVCPRAFLESWRLFVQGLVV